MTGDFDTRHGIAAAQIPIFSVFLGFGVFFRLQRKNGWFSISLFSTIRLVGASCMLATLTTDARGVWAAVFVCDNECLNVWTSWHFRIPELICWAGIGVSVADFVRASNRENAMAPSALTRVSVGLFVALFAWTVLLFVYIFQSRHQLPATKKRGVVGVGIAIPFMTIRTLQTLIYTATATARFSAVTGSAIIYLFMTILPEVGVLSSIVWAIMGSPPMSKKVRVPSEDGSEFNDLTVEGRRP
ncbi:hypothetical protein BKA56DRAFT_719070 [Ilyonectria sp. MPI-CAGE-AT-0026]|nr:hypothetical protein BKA56DRAFT_719070 [Ilyonectria sp. MPI-CAGE-AT-0026]